MQNSKNKDLLLAEKLNEEGKYEDALQIIFDLEQKGNLSPFKQLSCNLIKCSIIVRLGQYNEVISLAERTAQESQKLGKKLQIVDAFILKAKALYWLRRLDEGLDILDQAERLLKTLISKTSLEINERRAWIAWVRGVIYHDKRERELQLKHLELGLELGKKTGNNQIIFLCLMLIGWYYMHKGEVDQAINYTIKSLEITKLMQNQTIAAWSYENLAFIYYEKGELDYCIKYQKKAYKVYKHTNNKLHLSGALNNFGFIYMLKGDKYRALKYFKRSLAMYEEIGVVEGICIALDGLIKLTLDEGDYTKAHLYFNRLKHLNQEEDQKYINLLFKLDNALILKKDPRVMNQSRAKNLLLQILNEEDLDFDLYITALLELCALYLRNLKDTNDLKIFDMLRPYLSQLIEIAKKIHSYSLLAETYLLQAKIEIITLDLNEAQRSLIKAHQITKNYGLDLLRLRILDEQDELQEHFSKWENFKISKAIIADRMELASIDEQLLRMLRKRVRLEKAVF